MATSEVTERWQHFKMLIQGPCPSFSERLNVPCMSDGICMYQCLAMVQECISQVSPLPWDSALYQGTSRKADVYCVNIIINM